MEAVVGTGLGDPATDQLLDLAVGRGDDVDDARLAVGDLDPLGTTTGGEGGSFACDRLGEVGELDWGERVGHDPSMPERDACRNANGPVRGGRGRFIEWRVRDSNPRRLRRLIYSQIPLAAWVTRHVRTRLV